MTESMGVPGGLEARTQVMIVIIGIAMLLIVLNMVRRKQLREQYSLLWLLSAIVLIVSALFVRQIDTLAMWVGINYPPAFFFLVAILLMLLLQFHFSSVISNLREQNRALAQNHGVLAAEVRRLRRHLESSSDREDRRPTSN